MFSQASIILFTGGCLADTPRADTPWADTPCGQTHPTGQTPPWADTPPRMATAADSMHPTGMLSWFL